MTYETSLPTPVSGLVATPEAKLRALHPQTPMVPRRRVLDRIAAAPYQSVAIDAPGGFGKSTLAAQWASESPISAWASLDSTDSDPVVLISTLLNALSTTISPQGDGLDERAFHGLSGEDPAFSRWVLPQFRRAVETASHTALVIDNVHIVEGRKATSVLVALIESLPPGCSVALVGRGLGGLPVARWYGQGRLLEVGPRELIFDPAEIEMALAGFRGKPPSPELMTEIKERTGGWPVAVYLAAIADVGRRTSGSATVEEYIRKEILTGLDPALVGFLQRTAPLDALTPALCDAVLEQDSSADLLRLAESDAHLIHRLEGKSEWYRLHDFLREHLLAESMRSDSDAARQIHARASVWYHRAGFSDLAIRHALASGDPGLMGATIWPAASVALLHGQGGRVRQWLSELDDAVLIQDPGLSLTAAWTAISLGEYPDAMRWAELTAGLLGPDWMTKEESDASTVAAGFSLLVSLSGAGGWRKAAEMTGSAQDRLPVDDELRIFAEFCQGWYSLLGGDGYGGITLMEHAHALATSHEMRTTQTEIDALLALVSAQRGELRNAWKRIHEAQAHWERHDRDTAITTAAILAVASAFVAVVGEGGDCRRPLAIVLELLPKVELALPWYSVVAHATAAHCLADGDVNEAVAHFEAAEQGLDGPLDSGFLRELVASAGRYIQDAQVISVLSPAERRVWELLAGRMTVREIADCLLLSAETVKSHTSTIYRKLNVATRREAQELAETLTADPSVLIRDSGSR